jgi:hypothetical protein
VREGVVSDMWDLKVVQPLLVNTSEIALATECVGMILKIGKLLILIFIPDFICSLQVFDPYFFILLISDDLIAVR